MTVVAGSKPTVVSTNLLHPAQYSDSIYFPWRQYCYPKSIFTMKTFQLIKRILSLLIFKTSQFNISHACSLARPYSVLFWKLRRSRDRLNGWHVGVTDNQVPENKVAGLRRDAASPSTGKNATITQKGPRYLSAIGLAETSDSGVSHQCGHSKFKSRSFRLCLQPCVRRSDSSLLAAASFPGHNAVSSRHI